MLRFEVHLSDLLRFVGVVNLSPGSSHCLPWLWRIGRKLDSFACAALAGDVGQRRKDLVLHGGQRRRTNWLSVDANQMSIGIRMA